MSRAGIFETLVGIVVVFVAAAFLFYCYQTTGRSGDKGTYGLNAVFGRIDGIAIGSEVKISGVKVGAVTESVLDPATFEAKVSFNVRSSVQLPEDSIAKVVSDGLLGGAHVSIEPGASEYNLAAGDTITLTQGSIDLLGLAVQSFTNSSSGDPSTSGDSE